jgi:hypothetical protein
MDSLQCPYITGNAVVPIVTAEHLPADSSEWKRRSTGFPASGFAWPFDFARLDRRVPPLLGLGPALAAGVGDAPPPACDRANTRARAAARTTPRSRRAFPGCRTPATCSADTTRTVSSITVRPYRSALPQRLGTARSDQSSATAVARSFAETTPVSPHCACFGNANCDSFVPRRFSF